VICCPQSFAKCPVSNSELYSCGFLWRLQSWKEENTVFLLQRLHIFSPVTMYTFQPLLAGWFYSTKNSKWLLLLEQYGTCTYGSNNVTTFCEQGWGTDIQRVLYCQWHLVCFLTDLLTYLFIPCSKFHLQELTVSQLVKFPAFYETRRFMTAFTKARQLSLSWARSIQSMPRFIFYENK